MNRNCKTKEESKKSKELALFLNHRSVVINGGLASWPADQILLFSTARRPSFTVHLSSAFIEGEEKRDKEFHAH
jgi:hypothetical protein